VTTAATITARLILDQTEFKRGLQTASTEAQNFGSKLRNIGSSLTTLGGTAAGVFTVPIVAAAKTAITAYSELDTQIRNIQSITGQTDSEMQALRDTFITMSSDASVTRDTAQELAEAFYFIQSAGFSGDKGMTVLNAATQAASAGLTDTMTAGNAIIATLNAYGMGAEDAAYVSDVLFKTVDLGVLTFEDLATQLGDVVNTAAMTETGIDEVERRLGLED